MGSGPGWSRASSAVPAIVPIVPNQVPKVGEVGREPPPAHHGVMGLGRENVSGDLPPPIALRLEASPIDDPSDVPYRTAADRQRRLFFEERVSKAWTAARESFAAGYGRAERGVQQRFEMLEVAARSVRKTALHEYEAWRSSREETAQLHAQLASVTKEAQQRAVGLELERNRAFGAASSAEQKCLNEAQECYRAIQSEVAAEELYPRARASETADRGAWEMMARTQQREAEAAATRVQAAEEAGGSSPLRGLGRGLCSSAANRSSL